MEEKTAVIVKTSKKAILSFIFSILNLYFLGTLLSIILGHLAKHDIKKSNGSLKGKGWATAGLVISYLSLLIALILITLALQKLQARGAAASIIQ